MANTIIVAAATDPHAHSMTESSGMARCRHRDIAVLLTLATIDRDDQRLAQEPVDDPAPANKGSSSV
jgi:hypothetical protein